MTFLDGLTFGAGQAIGQAFTFLVLVALFLALLGWIWRRIVG